MKVFISHSGDRSKALAEKIEWFVRNVLPATNPWVSTGIDKGSRWEPEIAENLADANVGIVCLTAENLNERWILFESGALSKRLDGKVWTVLLDVTSSQVKPPLSQFQDTKAERSDLLKLILTINRALQRRRRREDDVRDALTRYWPDLETAIRELRSRAPVALPARKPEDMLVELLGLARANIQQSWMQEKTLKMLHQIYVAVLGKPAPSLVELRQMMATKSWLSEVATPDPHSRDPKSLRAKRRSARARSSKK